VTAGGLAALGPPVRALAVAPLVSLQLRVFIPSLGVSYLGDLFGGGDKAVIEGTIDLGRT